MYQGSQALPMLDSKIDVKVRGPIVEAVVTQKFRNATDHATEAVYIFPLPADAAVTAMSIRIGDRTIHAAIERRDQAQRRYEEAVAAGIGAGLLDQERPDVFTQTVSAIPPRGTVEVTLRYDTVASFHDGTWQLVVPLVVAPRFVPGTASGLPTTGSGRIPDTNRAPDASRVTPPSAPGAGGPTAMAIEFAGPVDAVTSPTHELAGSGATRRLVDRHSDHDAIIRWRAPVPTAGWVEQDGEGGFAAIVVQNETKPAARPGAVRCVLAIDRAATTRGDADAVEHPFVRGLLHALDAGSRVSVIGSDKLGWGAPDQAIRALDATWSRPAGAFDLTHVLAGARTDGAPIVLVSDGLIADDAAAIAAARKLGVPVHVIGVGPTPAHALLEQLASSTGGTVRFAIPGDDLDAIARDLIADLANPPAPVTVTWGTLVASDIVPAVMPKLGTGQATLVVARVKTAQRANGRARGELFAIETVRPQHAVDGATTTGGALARRWARSRLDELIASYAKPAAIAAHAMQYGLVSPYTSMVAIGTEVTVTGGVKHSVSVPVSVPAGMRWQPVKRETTVATAEPAQPPPPTVTQDYHRNVPSPTRTFGDDKTKSKDSPKNEPRPAPVKQHEAEKPVTEADDAPKKKAKKHDRGDDDDDADAKADKPAKEDRDQDERPRHHNKPKAPAGAGADETGGVEPSAAPPTVATLDRTLAEDVEVRATSYAPRNGYRLSLQLGGGVAFHGGTGGLGALSGRIEFGERTLVGVDSSLWLVGDNLTLEGQILAGVSRVGIARYLELGAGVGVHLGDGVGPAASLRMRAYVPPLGRHVGLYLRYDAALLFDRGAREGDNALTLGLDYAF
jgi:Ca-activated chloride channel family protein